MVEAGSMAIIPGGIPHREVVLEREVPFENLVISVYNETVSVQLQVAGGEGKAHVAVAEYYDTAKYQQLAQYLEESPSLATAAARASGLASRACC